MPQPYRAVLFDFDGTLADSYSAITASVNFVRSKHSLPPLDESAVRTLVGHGILQLMEQIAPGSDPQASAQTYMAHHPSVMFTHTHLLPGVAETLIALQRSAVRMAVCSNKPVSITKKLLDSLGISSYFDAAYGPEDAGKPKPDPAMVQLALRKLGISPSQAVYVGDMPVDVETARNAGVTVFVLPTGSSDLETLTKVRPDRIFQIMTEIPPVVLGVV